MRGVETILLAQFKHMRSLCSLQRFVVMQLRQYNLPHLRQCLKNIDKTLLQRRHSSFISKNSWVFLLKNLAIGVAQNSVLGVAYELHRDKNYENRSRCMHARNKHYPLQSKNHHNQLSSIPILFACRLCRV